MPESHKCICLRNIFIAVLSMSISNLISVFIFAVLLVRITSAKYYPDIVYETGNSCSERTIFATNKDPFYQWITRSYLVDGFQQEAASFTIQEAGTSYKKLSEWRVANSSSSNGTVKMFNSPEPHVIGGSFRKHKRIARMTVNWGLSIRICLGYRFGQKGQNMCRYTGQVIAVKKDNVTHINFKMLLSQVYFNNTQQKVTYLTNWVSNARFPGAVEENRRIEDINASFWYYSNPLLETSCDSSRYIYYRPDMVAYLGDSFEECTCVRNVCVQTMSGVFPVRSGEFSKSSYPCNNESVRSYWLPLDIGVYLYSFNSKFNASYYMLPTTFTTSNFFEEVQNSTTINEMESLSSCFEAWLDGLSKQLTTFNLSEIACVSNRVNWSSSTGYIVSNAIIGSDVRGFWSSLKQALATGDNCQENNKEETVCSSDILKPEQKQGIENLLIDFIPMKEVHAYAKSQWEEMGTKLHGAYVDIVTAILAFFGATVVVSSRQLVEIEQFLVNCWCWLSKQCIRRQGNNVQQMEIKLPYSELKPQAPQELHSSLAVFVRWIIRFAVLVGVICQFAYTTWDTFDKLKSGPDVGWTQTIEYQPSEFMAFLVTITSTTQVAPKWINMYILGAIIGPWFFFAVTHIHKHVLYWPASPKP